MGVVYKITNIVNGKVYVGKTITEPARRWSQHKAEAAKGRPFYFYKAMRKHGIENFVFEVVEHVLLDEMLDVAEIEWIAKLDSTNPGKGYNSLTGGQGGRHGPLSRIHSIECRAKISANKKGFVITPGHREKINEAWKGAKHSPETLKKMSDSHRRTWTPEKRAAFSAMRKRMWAEGLVKPHLHTEESKAKMRGRKKSEETRAKMSKAQRARTYLGKVA